MKTTLGLCVVMSVVMQIAAGTASGGGAEVPAGARAQNVPASLPAKAAGSTAALEQKLLGTWNGPPCGGNYTFNTDGTYECRSFTPGGNTLTGTWVLRWDALPPTLVLTCKTSDFTKKDSTRQEYQYLGRNLELKVLELNEETLVYRLPSDSVGVGRGKNDNGERRFERRGEK